MQQKKSSWQEPFDVHELTSHVDKRGFLFEILRLKDSGISGEGQIYTFSIEPFSRRGDHYHLEKREWFTCVHGEAFVLLSTREGEKARVILSAVNPKVVYAGPGAAHALINETDQVAVIVSYGSKQHDPDHPDTYMQIVEEEN